MVKLRTTLICTVLNEEKTIGRFLDSIASQSKFPDEIIIVDGGSKDETIQKISEFKFPDAKNFPNIKLLFKNGNRAIGRNEAISNASGDIILISDSGCILDKNWIRNITIPFNDKKMDVVAGYYKGLAKSSFQKSLIPYVLVMPDKVNKNEFLPATRSMALRKSVWQSLKGFNEKLSHNEDFAFANKIKEAGIKIYFKKSAIVYWLPRKNLIQSFKMFFRFALGDVQSGIFREKVLYIFLRYILAVYLLILGFIEKSLLLNSFLILVLGSYIGWSVWKNYKYVKAFKAIIYLPLLQFTSDLAVLLGSTLGLLQKIFPSKIHKLIARNKGVALIIALYIVSMLAVVTYGIPSPSHPFDYFMDEWHQSQSVRDLFRYGTPNLPGAANGSIFQFFLSGLYLIPFYALHVVNPFAIKSSVLNLEMQSRLFEIFKLNTLVFGVASISLVAYIVKKYGKIAPFLAVFLFTVNPIWLMLSNYFKYDIALIFWSLLTFLFFVRYIMKPNFVDYLMAGIFTSLALSTKLLSPLPLFIVYVLMFFLYTPDLRKKLKTLFMGIAATIFVYAVFGNPDVILGRGSLSEYIYANLVQTPTHNLANFILGMDYKWYFLTRLYPAIFGHALYGLFLASLVFGSILVLKKTLQTRSLLLLRVWIHKENKLGVLAFLTFLVFAISLYPLKVEATNNRVLVLLPFMVIMTALFINSLWRWSKNKFLKGALVLIMIILLGIQFVECYSWFMIKLSVDPRQTSSDWIVQYLPKGTLIGIENIPIYQHLPDVILKEFYLEQYGVGINANFEYEVINSKSAFLPKVLVITNDELEQFYLRKSDKTSLVNRLKNNGYKIIAQFQPNFKYFKIFDDELEYYLSGLVQAPNTISIYEK
jgi:glycosyltransferase involved in cell wall biosynthesis